jgi:hypothetical protein
MNWDLKTIEAVRTLRSKVTIAVYDLEHLTVPEGEYMKKLRDRAVHNLREAVLAYGVDVDPDDIKFWEEPMAVPEEGTGDVVAYKNVCARWYPVTVSIELMGGPRDGEHVCLRDGEIGHFPYYTTEPILTDPEWLMEPDEVIPVLDVRKCQYVLGGWNPTKRIWIYTYGGTK